MDCQIQCVLSRKITPDGRFEDLRTPTTNGRRLSGLGYLTGRAPKGRADLVPETRPISRFRQKVDGASGEEHVRNKPDAVGSVGNLIMLHWTFILWKFITDRPFGDLPS